MDVMLIYPPVAKPSEPPAGIARLAGFLEKRGGRVRTIDASLNGLLFLMKSEGLPKDTWTARASARTDRNLAFLKDFTLYRGTDRYTRAVSEIERVLWASSGLVSAGTAAGLADYRDGGLLPVRSADLLASAGRPERNPFYGYYYSHVIPAIEKDPPDIIGLSVNYLSQAVCAFALAGLVRARFPNMRIVMGGGLVTAWKGLPGWNGPFGGLVDDMVAGRGEAFFGDILGAGDDGDIGYEYSFSPDDLHEYLSPCSVMPFSASSACCWNRCSFCQERATAREGFSCDGEQALASLSRAIGEYAPGLVHFTDSTIPPAFLKTIAANPPGVSWYGFTRITKTLGEKDFCEALRRSGCRMLKLGVESGDQGVLDMLDKGIDVKTAERVLRSLKESGIATYVYLLFGTPPEDYGSAMRTLDFVRRNHAFIDFMNTAIFNLPSACAHELGAGVREFYEGDLGLYRDFIHPKGWDRKKVRAFMDRQFKRDASVSAILRRTPRIFTSNHAPFFDRPYL